MNDYKLTVNVDNLDDLKKLIKLAQDQTNQLQETLCKINEFKIQVS